MEKLVEISNNIYKHYQLNVMSKVSSQLFTFVVVQSYNFFSCHRCGKLLCSEKEAQVSSTFAVLSCKNIGVYMIMQAHATRTGHSQFSESVEEIKPLTEEEKKEQQRKSTCLLLII